MDADEIVTVPALEQVTGRTVSLNVHRDQLYKIEFRTGKILYGWFSTDPREIMLAHKKAGIKSDKIELLVLKHIWNTEKSVIERSNMVLDIENEVLFLTKVKFFIKNKISTTDMIESSQLIKSYENDYMSEPLYIHYGYPIAITLLGGIRYIGTILKYRKRSFIHKEDSIKLQLIPDEKNPNRYKNLTIELELKNVIKTQYVDISLMKA